MVLVSGPKWEGFGLGGQFPLTVPGSGQGGVIIIAVQERVVRHQSFTINIVV